MIRYLALVFEVMDDDISDTDLIAAGEEAARWVDFEPGIGAYYNEVLLRSVPDGSMRSPFSRP